MNEIEEIKETFGDKRRTQINNGKI